MEKKKFQIGKAKIWILSVVVIVIVLGIGGFFYFWKVYLPKNAGLGGERSEPPKLFSKGDYKVEERQDAKYIVVDKVGLTAKVPDGWKVEIKNTSDVDSNEYWVSLYSLNATGTDYLKKGCKINVTATNGEEYNKDLRERIVKLKNNEAVESYGIVKMIENKIIKINDGDALSWLSDIHEIAGQFAGLSIPIGLKTVLEMNASFAKDFSQQCSPVWEEFVKTIEIK